MQCLVAQDLSFGYGRRSVLDGVNLRVVPGRATALVGPSGSGKTTLIWLLAGLLRPAAGRVGLVEEGPTAAQADDPAAHGRMPIGMVFQQPALWDHLTVERHLELVLAGRGLARADRRQRVDRALSQMRLDPLRRRRPGQLSGGERQRLAIARALVGRPRWLLLDEPLAHLDGPVRGQLFELLRQALAEAQAGVLMATHSAAEALRLADDIVILLDGRVAQAGPAEEVYRRPVSLDAAGVLGPASEIRGDARDGVLSRHGQAILDGLDPSVAGPTRMILRPEDVEFCPDPAGPARVGRYEFAREAYYLYVEVAGDEMVVRSRGCVSSGTAGRLQMLCPRLA